MGAMAELVPEGTLTRSCPVCSGERRQIIYHQKFLEGNSQNLAACLDCGMVYAASSPVVNYDVDSKYAVAEASGSGENEMERERLRNTVRILQQSLQLSKSASILDIGCTRGGMLEALHEAGYENAMGMDPSAECVRVCQAKGLQAFQGTLDAEPGWKFDLVILSHVLEHVWDVREALEGVRRRLKPGGMFYIEVPDASRYVEFLRVPFLDINREHVNHFSSILLGDALHMAQLDRGTKLGGKREITFATGEYPAIYAIGGESKRPRLDLLRWESDTELSGLLRQYVVLSERMLKALDDQIAVQTTAGEQVAVWGYGEFLQQLMRLKSMQSLDIVQVVDQDPRKVGKKACGVFVEYPQMLRPGVPVVVASMVNRNSILRDMHRMGLKNPMVTLR